MTLTVSPADPANYLTLFARMVRPPCSMIKAATAPVLTQFEAVPNTIVGEVFCFRLGQQLKSGLPLSLRPEPSLFRRHRDLEAVIEFVKTRVLLVDGGVNFGQDALLRSRKSGQLYSRAIARISSCASGMRAIRIHHHHHARPRWQYAMKIGLEAFVHAAVAEARRLLARVIQRRAEPVTSLLNRHHLPGHLAR